MVLFPLLFYGILVLGLIVNSDAAISFDLLRRKLLTAAVIWGVVVTAITEILSSLHLIAVVPLASIWAMACAVGAVCSWRLAKRRLTLQPLRKSVASFSAFERLFSAMLVVLIFGTGINATFATPITFDAMTYHLTRIVHWQQQHSVVFFPTENLRQILFAPWAEYVLLHLQLLSGGDHYTNFVQWFSFLGCLVGITAIAAELGASRQNQLLTGVLCATLPMAVLQASTAQNDLVLSFWIVCLVYSILRLTQSQVALNLTAEAGAALGLALFTKGTAFVFAPPFLAWYFLQRMSRFRSRALPEFALIGIIVVGINASHAAKKIQLYGGLSGLTQEAKVYRLSNEIHTPAAFVSNVVRNTAIHFGTPSHSLSLQLNQAVHATHIALGISATDPRTTFFVQEFTVPKGELYRSEDYAGNPLHLILFGICTVWFLANASSQSGRVKSYLLAVLSCAVLFCFALKWQPWHCRLHLTFFILTAPFCVVFAAQRFSQRVLAAIGGLLLAFALIDVFAAHSRPLVGRNRIFQHSRSRHYFANLPQLYAPWKKAVAFVQTQHWSRVGLYFQVDDYEYPLWLDLQRIGVKEIEQVGVTNPSASLASKSEVGSFAPQAIITVSKSKGEEVAAHFPQFRRVWSQDDVAIFVSKEASVTNQFPAR